MGLITLCENKRPLTLAGVASYFKSAFEVRMAAKKPAKPKRKLPARYPRDQEIIIFEDMGNLDRVLERLSELEKSLVEIIVETWIDYTKHSVLYGMAIFLRKAYIELERFHEREGWSYEADISLQDDFKSVGSFRHRLNDLEQGRLIDMPARTYANGYVWPAYTARSYEPAQHACAHALYLAMLMMECVCDEHELKTFMADFRYYLTRYHAASLEIAAGRSAVFLPGKKIGAKSNIHQYLDALYEAQTDGIDRKAFEKVIDSECQNRTVDRFRMVTLQKTTDDKTLLYIDGRQQKTIKISTILNRHKFPKGKKPKSKN